MNRIRIRRFLDFEYCNYILPPPAYIRSVSYPHCSCRLTKNIRSISMRHCETTNNWHLQLPLLTHINLKLERDIFMINYRTQKLFLFTNSSKIGGKCFVYCYKAHKDSQSHTHKFSHIHSPNTYLLSDDGYAEDLLCDFVCRCYISVHTYVFHKHKKVLYVCMHACVFEERDYNVS